MRCAVGAEKTPFGGLAKITRFGANVSGQRNIQLDWPGGASVLVRAEGVASTEVVSRILAGMAEPSPRRPKLDVMAGACVRFSGGKAWLLNNSKDGWSAFGYWHESLEELLSQWAVAITGACADETGPYLIAEPAEVRHA